MREPGGGEGEEDEYAQHPDRAEKLQRSADLSILAPRPGMGGQRIGSISPPGVGPTLADPLSAGWVGSGMGGQRIGSISPPGVGPTFADPLSAGWVGRWWGPRCGGEAGRRCAAQGLD